MRGYLGVDTGGTFTDFVLWNGKEWKFLKLPSTPQNPALAVLEGVNELRGEEPLLLLHGTTVATNALLERKGAKTAFVTNEGFEDLLEIGRQNRERLYDLYYKKPPPLVPRELRFGLKVRTDEKGRVLEELKEEELEELIKKLKEKGVLSVAVCFLHSYANPEHEKKVGERLKKEGFFVSLSHELVREFREYERASTTAVNAYVSPKMSTYLKSLEEGLKEKDLLLVMQSNGGLLPPEKAGREAVRTVLSGPAGGVIGALAVAKEAGVEKLITFDMGGTSTDVSLVEGEPKITTEGKVAGLPLKVPMIEIHTVGAGGGSIARIDEGGALRVGPESAGAVPGPICYGKGGKELTVTDANLFLGRLEEDFFLGGKMKLYRKPVEEAFKKTAELYGMEPLRLAEGIITVVNATMERAIKKVSVERGYDPAEFTLVPFGGAGGLHALLLAENLRINNVLLPPNPGLLSALGTLTADALKERSLTLLKEEPPPQELEPLFGEMERELYEELRSEGFKEVVLERLADLRFKGQSYELTVPFSRLYKESFKELHERVYGYAHEGVPVELVNLRVRARGLREKPPLPKVPFGGKELSPEATLKEKELYFEGEKLKAPVILRDELKAGNLLRGPALVVEYTSTLFIPPRWRGEVDPYGNLHLYL